MATNQVFLNGKEIKSLSGEAPTGIRKAIEDSLPGAKLQFAGSSIVHGKKTCSVFGRLDLNDEKPAFLGVTLLKKDGILNIKVNGYPDIEQTLKEFIENYKSSNEKSV